VTLRSPPYPDAFLARPLFLRGVAIRSLLHQVVDSATVVLWLVRRTCIGAVEHVESIDARTPEERRRTRANIRLVRLAVPLVALEELATFDRDNLGEVLGCVELSPVALGDHAAQHLPGLLVDHTVTLADS
jgi:hypothetical protein